MSGPLPQYRAARAAAPVAKLVCKLPEAELEAIDRWGVAVGMPSRTATVRHLLRKAIEASDSGEPRQ